MNGKKYDIITKYNITASCIGPMHIGGAIGDRSDILVNPVNGRPFIQASGINGAFRDYYASVCGEKAADALFGMSRAEEDDNVIEGKAHINIGDGHFNNDVRMEYRPHVRIDRASGSVSSSNGSGQKFEMEYIGVGNEFIFNVYVYSVSGGTKYDEEFEHVLAGMKAGSINFGAKKSSGAGSIGVKKVLKRRFDMQKEGDRNAWISNDEIMEDVTASIKAIRQDSAKYTVNVSGYTEGAIQVKGISSTMCTTDDGENRQVSENIVNAERQYIIPGSSFRGAVRSQVEKIASYMNCSQYIEDMFGCAGESSGGGRMGDVRFYDTEIGDAESVSKISQHTRIHIDKFTGGVFQTGPFSEKNAAGDLKLVVRINDINNALHSLGLLLMALRDLAIGNMNVGNGYSIGKGIIIVEKIEVRDNESGNTAVLDFKTNDIKDSSGIVSEAIASLR